MALQGNYLLTTCWCGVPGIAVQAGQRSFGAVFSVLFAFSYFFLGVGLLRRGSFVSPRLGLPRAVVGSARVVVAADGGAGGGSVRRLC